jgi:hypothetical protein
MRHLEGSTVAGKCPAAGYSRCVDIAWAIASRGSLIVTTWKGARWIGR